MPKIWAFCEKRYGYRINYGVMLTASLVYRYALFTLNKTKDRKLLHSGSNNAVIAA
jgi:hypothetical protein